MLKMIKGVHIYSNKAKQMDMSSTVSLILASGSEDVILFEIRVTLNRKDTRNGKGD